jgi:hypothetical protein
VNTQGGVVSISGSKAIFNTCNFESNNFNNIPNFGALFINDTLDGKFSDVSLYDCTFKNNSGGAF